MAFLKCSVCSSMLKAVQISHRISQVGEQRRLEYTPLESNVQIGHP